MHQNHQNRLICPRHLLLPHPRPQPEPFLYRLGAPATPQASSPAPTTRSPGEAAGPQTFRVAEGQAGGLRRTSASSRWLTHVEDGGCQAVATEEAKRPSSW